ncbi:MAG: type II toxin-antitoxin system Phd/YefM family antitoxin [Gemmatimonadales bacterium]|nr:type II toxin-antitoxin system Phd/YefM family antitoxin [Gemmatimonadales bacterium]
MKKPAARTYNVHEAKTHLSKLLERTADGEEIIIARAGVPVARLVPIVASAAERPLGTERGAVLIAEDFDAPLPPDLLDAFER